MEAVDCALLFYQILSELGKQNCVKSCSFPATSGILGELSGYAGQLQTDRGPPAKINSGQPAEIRLVAPLVFDNQIIGQHYLFAST